MKKSFNAIFKIPDGLVQEYTMPFEDRTGTVKVAVAGGMGIVDSISSTHQPTSAWQHYNANPFVEMNFVIEGNMYQTHEGVLNRYRYDKGYHNILFNPYSLEKNELIGT